MALINCNDVTLGYDSNVVAKGLNFTVSKGDYLCIVGENGAGKSTLIKTVLGLQEPLDGKIVFGDGLLKNEIGYLPRQTIVQKDFPASVWEIVLSGCSGKKGFNPFYSKRDKALAMKNIRLMGIENLKNRCYRELSGGRQRRVLLARALCATKSVLLLDEPVSGLDPKVTRRMYDLISDLNKSGITIIMISHDIVAATKYSSHILQIGSKSFFGTKDEFLKSGSSLLGGDLNA